MKFEKYIFFTRIYNIIHNIHVNVNIYKIKMKENIKLELEEYGILKRDRLGRNVVI